MMVGAETERQQPLQHYRKQIPRASSNLELLSQTAIARVSPTEMKGSSEETASSSSSTVTHAHSWDWGKMDDSTATIADRTTFLPPFRPIEPATARRWQSPPPAAAHHSTPHQSPSGNQHLSPRHHTSPGGRSADPHAPHHHHAHHMVDELARDNALLRHELAEKNQVIGSLQHQLNELQGQIQELRQLPTGKISQIPVADMIELMQTYGSEVSDHPHLSLSSKSRKVQKASIVRQFRRWNPNFHEYFRHHAGQWIPKLGREGELERRKKSRAERRLRKVVGRN